MLSSVQKSDFEKDGYLVVENVVDQHAVLDPIRLEYAALLDTLYEGWRKQGLVAAALETAGFEDKLLAAYRAGCDWFQPMDISLPADRIEADTPMHFGQAVFNLVTAPALLDLVEDLIGPEITSNPIQHVRIKPPADQLQGDEVRAHITATDWHQDRGVTLEEADNTNMVTVWVAVSDATLDNGCLQVIPRAHHDGMKPHCPKTQTAIADGFIDETAARPLPVKSGGVVIFHPLTPHASRINTTDGFRWSFDLRYNVTGQPTGRAHFPSFVARSKAVPQDVVTSHLVWKQLWEQARDQLASRPHVNIHRWSAGSPACA